MDHRRMRSGGMGWVVASLATLLVGGSAIGAGAGTAVKPYLVPVGSAYDVTPLWSVNDTVPRTGHPGERFRMVGLPDGLGAHENEHDDTVTVYMNHEFPQTRQSQPVVGGATNRGAFVSKLLLDEDGDVLMGDRAYDTVYQGDQLVGPAAEVGNATPGFGRFCSGFLAGPEVGFDRQIFLTGEETEGSDSFDGRGGQSVAVFDGEAHALPALGHFSKENQIVMAKTGKRTVVLPMEDGPATPDSQLWLYVGEKAKSGSVLERNGLTGGTLYVFRSTTPGATSEATFQQGTIEGEWIPVPGAETMDAAQLEARADAIGAFTFIRPEDGAFNPRHKEEFLFVTTGGNRAAGNELGRLYQLRLHPSGDPRRGAKLQVAYNADQLIAAGEDTAISPDNIDVSREFVAINEDGTAESRAVMASKGRDGAIWRFPLRGGGWEGRVDVGAREMIAELDPPGRDGTPVGPGVWESSGIIDTTALFGAGSWLTAVQAHSPTAAPAPGTVEDGQLLLLTLSE